ncbi:MAG: phosphoserine phosphatase SerB [Acidimicrobiales bacterium]
MITVPKGKDLLGLLLFGWVRRRRRRLRRRAESHRGGIGADRHAHCSACPPQRVRCSGVGHLGQSRQHRPHRPPRQVSGDGPSWSCPCVDVEPIRSALLTVAKDLVCDLAVHREGLGRHAARLVVLDVDSTLIADEVIELIADEVGCRDEVAAITDRAMRGELDFAASLRERVALLAGLDAARLDAVRERVTLTPGARTFIRTLQRLGYHTAIVSGGFTAVTDHLAADLGIDHAHANELEIIDGVLTGRVLGDIVDRAAKADFVRRIAAQHGIPLDQVVAVGDGANDLDMLSAAGLGIAFNAKPIVAERADTSVNVPYLDAVLFVLGISRDEIEAADEAEGRALS